MNIKIQAKAIKYGSQIEKRINNNIGQLCNQVEQFKYQSTVSQCIALGN